MFKTTRKWLLTSFRQVKKIRSCFIEFKQIKNLVVILLTLNKSKT